MRIQDKAIKHLTGTIHNGTMHTESNYLMISISKEFGPNMESFGDFLIRMSKALNEMGNEFNVWELNGNDPILCNFLQEEADNNTIDKYEAFFELNEY